MDKANARGAGFMVLAMAAFAIEDMLYKSASQLYPAGLSLIIFGVLGTLLFAAFSILRREPVLHAAMLSRTLLIRTGFELGGRLFYALALALTPLASTSSILQATPLVVALGAVLFFGETVGWRRWIAMAVGFGGVLLILRPTPDSFEPYSIFAVLGVIGFAGRDLATRASPVTMSMAQLGTLGFTVVSTAGMILAIAGGEAMRLPEPGVLVRLAGAALFGVLAYGSLTQAMRSGEIGFVAPFRYTRLLFALALAVLVFDERPDQLTLIGGAVIVGSGLYSLLRQRRKAG